MISASSCTLACTLVLAQQGDRGAREQLAVLLHSELAPLVARAARDAGAEFGDVRQDTFLLLVEPRVPFDPLRGSARAYCFMAARSAADFGACALARSRQSEVDPNELLDAQSHRPAVETRDELVAVRAVDPPLFELMVLIRCEGVTAKDAGAQVGMTPSRMCRALQKYAARCNELLRGPLAA
jgi:DNA-directed RNA polymerase specialized sigma24 family protein